MRIEKSEKTAVYGFLTYLSAERWTRINLSFKHNVPMAIYFEGEKKGECLETKENQETTIEVALAKGIHRVGIAVLLDSQKDGEIEPNIKKIEDLPLPKVTLSSVHPLSWDDIMKTPFVIDTQLSNDGFLAALVVQQNDLESDKRIQTIQLWDCG
ncbi:MAG: hypothetical protein N2445_02055, partial [Acidobacteria bacterium]|nr:hypothetical protein [Acidobacteriota bacterium]